MAYSILMVDDEPLVLAGYRRLQGDYFKVQTAASAADGLRLLKSSGPFAVVVVDYDMPETDGIEFLLEARRLVPETVRIMLTGKGGLEVATDAVNRGNIYFYLTKPCPRDIFMAAITTAVEVYRDTGLITANPESGHLEALQSLHRGFIAFDNHEFESAAASFARARLLLKDLNIPVDLARANLLLAGALIQDGLGENAPDQNFSLSEIIEESLNIIEESSFFPLSRQEGHYVKPAFDWALENDIKPRALVKKIGFQVDREIAGSKFIQVRAFGSLQVLVGENGIEESDWRSPKTKYLFLYLLTNRHKKNELDFIYEIFWPDMPHRKAANNFSSCLYSIRQALGFAAVSYRKGLCWLNGDYYSCDADDFEKALKKAKVRLSEGREEEAFHLYNLALQLCRGEYLEEYSYYDWVTFERERLDSLRVEMLLDLAGIYASRQCYEEAAGLIEKTPLHKMHEDRLLQRLVNYYLLAGKKGKALRRYEYYRDRIAKELGAEFFDPQIKELLDQEEY